VLFVAYEASHMRLFIHVAKALRLQSSLVPILYCPYALPDEHEYRRVCIEAGIEYLQGHTAYGGRAALEQDIHTLAVRYSEAVAQVVPFVRPDLKEWVSRITGQTNPRYLISLQHQVLRSRASVRSILAKWESELPETVCHAVLRDFAFWLEAYRIELQWARELIARARVCAVVLAEHIAERDSVVWLRAAYEQGIIPVVLAQHTVSRKATFQTYSQDWAYAARNPVNAIFLEHFPQWRSGDGEVELSRLPASRALAQEWWGLSMPTPWVANSDPLTGIWVESRFLAQLYMREGVKRRYITVVGSPQLDKLAQALRPPLYGEKSEVWERLRLSRSEPLIICALPSNLYPRRRANGWMTYEELICDYLKQLQQLKNVRSVCALHPSADDAIVELLEAWKVSYVRDELVELLPHAKVYLVSGSSTAVWALACGVPVIDYDVYQLNHPLGSYEDGVYRVISAQQLQEILREIDGHFAPVGQRHKSEKFSELAHSAKKHAAYYGVLDGRCVERILAGISELVRRRLPMPQLQSFYDLELRETKELLKALDEMGSVQRRGGRADNYGFLLSGNGKGELVGCRHVPSVCGGEM
jgi:hypothetical protein